MSHRQIFTPQYTERSGPGSTLANSKTYRLFLEEFIREHAIQSILDLGCGDFEIMSNVDLRLRRNDGTFVPVYYTGVDVIDERIERNEALALRQKKEGIMHFICDDVLTYLKSTWHQHHDLVIVKDVLQHWCNREIFEFFTLALGRWPHLMIVNCNYGETVNRDIATGDWRALDLRADPFNLKADVLLRYGTPETGGIKDVLHFYDRSR